MIACKFFQHAKKQGSPVRPWLPCFFRYPHNSYALFLLPAVLYLSSTAFTVRISTVIRYGMDSTTWEGI